MPNPPEPIFSITSNVSVSFVKLRRSWSRSENSEESSVELKSILGWFVLGELEMNFEVLMAVRFALFTTWRWRHSWISSSNCFSSGGFSCLTDFFSSLRKKLNYIDHCKYQIILTPWSHLKIYPILPKSLFLAQKSSPLPTIENPRSEAFLTSCRRPAPYTLISGSPWFR